ncbi:MAG: TatD family hydrolase [bacterium]|nr:TatD family hydrolase [bacterium]
MLIDTHAHLNFKEFNKDRSQVIKRAFEGEVEKIINVGTNLKDSKDSILLAEKYKNISATIGLHPIDVQNERFGKKVWLKLAKHQKVVAIGEIGLDYYYKPKTKRKLELFKEKQRTVLCQQLKLAKELNLPVIFHCRAAHDDLLVFLEDRKCNKSTGVNLLHRGVIHCFTGNWQQAERYLEMGFYIGFNGIIFKSIEGINFEENIKRTPLDRILIETDCPFLTPPQAKPVQERNEPLYVKFVAQRIAEIKNLTFEQVAGKTTENAKKLFNI